MKTWLLLLFIPCVGLQLSAQISIGENLRLEGSGAFGYVSSDSSTSGKTTDLSVEELFVKLHLGSGKVTAGLDLHLEGPSLDVEEALVNYVYNEMLTLSIGQFRSLLFYEADHFSERLSRTRAQEMFSEIVPLENRGIRSMIDTEKGWLTVSWTDQLWDQPTGRGGVLTGSSGSVEVQLGYKPLEGLKLAYAYGGQDSGGDGPNSQLWDVWISYERDKYLLVAEYVDFDNAGAQDADSNGILAKSEYLSGKTWMLLGNYQHDEKTSFTLRFSEEEQTGGGKSSKWTLTPSYALTDNLGARLEFSRDDRTQPALADEEIDTFSLEGLFRF